MAGIRIQRAGAQRRRKRELQVVLVLGQTGRDLIFRVFRPRQPDAADAYVFLELFVVVGESGDVVPVFVRGDQQVECAAGCFDDVVDGVPEFHTPAAERSAVDQNVRFLARDTGKRQQEAIAETLAVHAHTNAGPPGRAAGRRGSSSAAGRFASAALLRRPRFLLAALSRRPACRMLPGHRLTLKRLGEGARTALRQFRRTRRRRRCCAAFRRGSA